MDFRSLVLASSVILAACGSSSDSPTGPGPTNDATSDGTTNPDGSGDDTSVADGPGADTTPSVPTCVATCSAPSDCATSSAAFDADNYACESGRCRYVGCKNDDECKSTFSSAFYACRTIVTGGLATCVHTCTAPKDCVTAPGGAYGEANWSCESGACHYLGCKTDDECKTTFSAPNYVCRALVFPGFEGLIPSGAKNCVKSCTTEADCDSASPAYDKDNFVCDSGACRYIGCKNDKECQDSLSKPNYVCK